MLAGCNMQIAKFRIFFAFYKFINVVVIDFDYTDNFYTQ